MAETGLHNQVQNHTDLPVSSTEGARFTDINAPGKALQCSEAGGHSRRNFWTL